MDTKTYILFVNGTFEDHEEIEYLCMDVISESPAVKKLRYVIENDDIKNIIVIFDSDYDNVKLSKELLSVMMNDTVNYYFLFPLYNLVTAHLPVNLKDFIFKPLLSNDKPIEEVKTTPNTYDLDEVLEKINTNGFDSLTDEEKKFLENFSN